MAQNSKIEWTDHTWNPTVGCSIVSPGCTNCYAMQVAHGLERRFDSPKYRGLTKVVNGNAVWTGEVRLDEAALLQPLKWKKGRRIFVNSMSDLFHESLSDEAIDKVFAVMALTPQHTFQILTKRAKRMRDYINEVDLAALARYQAPSITQKLHRTWPLDNVWLGISCERQQEADERIPLLLQTPAAVRFISAEPLLGPIDLSNWLGKTSNHGISLFGLDDQKRPHGLEEGQHVVGSMDLPDAHRLPSLPDPLVFPSGGATHDGAQPFDHGRGGAIDRASDAPAGLGVAPPVNASLSVKQSGDVASHGEACGHLDRPFERHPPNPPQRHAAAKQFAPDSLSTRPQVCADALYRGAASIGIDDADRPIRASGKGHDQYPTGASLDWIIAGGESGVNARPMHPAWARSLRDQCAAAGVAFFFKQWGEWAPGGPFGATFTFRVGKKAAGRLLDGREHSEFPSTDGRERA